MSDEQVFLLFFSTILGILHHPKNLSDGHIPDYSEVANMAMDALRVHRQFFPKE